MCVSGQLVTPANVSLELGGKKKSKFVKVAVTSHSHNAYRPITPLQPEGGRHSQARVEKRERNKPRRAGKQGGQEAKVAEERREADKRRREEEEEERRGAAAASSSPTGGSVLRSGMEARHHRRHHRSSM